MSTMPETSEKPVAFVIQRFGETVAGGAEAHCRRIALKLAEHRPVEVWTTTAQDYRSWRNQFPEGIEIDCPLRVMRFKVDRPRAADFDARTARLLAQAEPSLSDQLSWLVDQGPQSDGLLDHIRKHAGDSRAVIFYTYLYWPTYHGVAAAPDKAILVPTLHDEPVAHFPMFRSLLSAPTSLLFLTPEEQDFAQRAFQIGHVPQRMLGTAVEPPPEAPRAPDSPRRYLLYLGRVDAGKGAAELARHFIRFIEAHGVRFDDVELVYCGELLMPRIEHRRIRYLGFRSAPEVASWLRHAAVLVAPSPFESLSLVALEAMAAGVPVLANARSEVLAGHCHRSGAGLWYTDFQDFEESLGMLLSDAELRRKMAPAGRRYIAEHYSWASVEATLNWAIENVPT